MQLRQDIQEKNPLTANEIGQLLPGIAVQEIEKWMNRDRNYQDKLQRLISPHTSQQDIDKLIDNIEGGAGLDHATLPRDLFIDNQYYALFGDDASLAALQHHKTSIRFWLGHDPNNEKLFQELKCHRAVGCLLKNIPFELVTDTHQGIQPNQVKVFDEYVCSHFARDFSHADMAERIKKKFGLTKDLFASDAEFNEAKQQALFSGIWGENQEIAALEFTRIETKLNEIEQQFFPQDTVAPFRADTGMPVEHQPRLGGIISSEQYQRYQQMHQHLQKIITLNFEEAQEHFKAVSIPKIIEQIDHFKNEIDQALELCHHRFQFLLPLLNDFDGRDSDLVENKTQRERIVKSEKKLRELVDLNDEQYELLSEIKKALYKVDDNKPCLQQVLKNLSDKIQPRKESVAQLNIPSHIYEVKDYVRKAGQSEADFLSYIDDDMRDMAGLPVPDTSIGTKLKVGQAVEKSAFKYVEKPAEGAVRAHFCQASREITDANNQKQKVTDVAAFKEMQRADGSIVFQHDDIDDEKYQVKINLVLDLCYKARIKAEMAPVQENVDASQRQPLVPFVLETKNILDAAIYYFVLTECYGLTDKSFLCNISTDQIKAYLNKSPGITQAISNSGAADCKLAWQMYADDAARKSLAQGTAVLFAEIARGADAAEKEVTALHDTLIRIKA